MHPELTFDYHISADPPIPDHHHFVTSPFLKPGYLWSGKDDYEVIITVLLALDESGRVAEVLLQKTRTQVLERYMSALLKRSGLVW